MDQLHQQTWQVLNFWTSNIDKDWTFKLFEAPFKSLACTYALNIQQECKLAQSIQKVIRNKLIIIIFQN